MVLNVRIINISSVKNDKQRKTSSSAIYFVYKTLKLVTDNLFDCLITKANGYSCHALQHIVASHVHGNQ